MARRRWTYPAEASLNVAVNLPRGGYEQHALRIVKLLRDHGYESYPMTGEYVLKLADQIRSQTDQTGEAA